MIEYRVYRVSCDIFSVLDDDNRTLLCSFMTREAADAFIRGRKNLDRNMYNQYVLEVHGTSVLSGEEVVGCLIL